MGVDRKKLARWTLNDASSEYSAYHEGIQLYLAYLSTLNVALDPVQGTPDPTLERVRQVEIIKVLGTPTREELMAMNPNYTELTAQPWPSYSYA